MNFRVLKGSAGVHVLLAEDEEGGRMVLKSVLSE
jgi:hypothetical protein